MTMMARLLVLLVCVFACMQVSYAFMQQRIVERRSTLFAYSMDSSGPSDYDTEDLLGEKDVSVDKKEEDAIIRDALKREILLLSSVTDRGEYATKDEQDMLIELVNELEALNPTENPAEHCEGEWDLALSSTQFFRSSPFFLTIRSVMGDSNKAMVENAFDIHDRATTASRVGRVRQTITNDKLISEVDLEVGLLPGFPLRVTGTVVTTASLDIVSSKTWELKIEKTLVKGSNVPVLNQFLDNLKIELPMSDFYNAVQGQVPVVEMKTFYLDEGLRISRDVDDNFFVFTRA